jgi:hypothetical protein
MALKWMWGFEIGADETFYSASNWMACAAQQQIWPQDPGGADEPFNVFQKTKDLYDFKYNFPHQPSGSVGGGYYSFKIEPYSGYRITASYGLSVDFSSPGPFSILSPSFGRTHSGSFSFSMYCDFDQTQLPISSSGESWYAQRFLSLYPDETIASHATTNGDMYFLSGSNNVLPSMIPQLQLFMFRSGSGGVVKDGILAVCHTGSIDGVALEGTLGATVNYGFGLGMIQGYLLKEAERLTAIGAPIANYVYSSSFGYISGSRWTKVAVQYTPHRTNGTLKVYLNEDLVMNQVGVPTGYTSSVNPTAPVPYVRADVAEVGRIGFTATPWFIAPEPWNEDNPSSYSGPASFAYDHICVFDEASDLSTATSSIFIQGLKPTSDSSIGNFTGDGGQVSSLYNYINDPNDAMETSYLKAAPSPETSCSFGLQDIDSIEEGAKLFDTGSVLSYIGVGIINAYENIGGVGNITVNSLMDNSAEATGSNYVVSASSKQMSLFVSGSNPAGGDWSKTDINGLKGGIKIS